MIRTHQVFPSGGTNQSYLPNNEIERTPPGSFIPLSIPAPDGTSEIYKSVNHPSVVFIPGGRFGYTHWMAFQPFPDNVRENPCIVASNDGINWEVPPGMSNPVETNAQVVTALGANAWHGDVELVNHADGTLALYVTCYIPSGNWQLVRFTLTGPGRSWSARAVLLTGVSFELVCPAIVVEEDGSCTMFYRKGTASVAGSFRFRTSTDHGLTWSAESAAVTLPATYYQSSGGNPPGSGGASPVPLVWHPAVTRVGEKYHMLALSSDPGTFEADDVTKRTGQFFYYYTALTADKTTWTLESYEPAIYPSGYEFDFVQFYRGCLVPIPGSPDSFDVYFTGQPRGNPVDETNGNQFPTVAVTLFDLGTDQFVVNSLSPCMFKVGDRVVLDGTTAPAGGNGFGTYYCIPDADPTIFKLATTRALAIAGTSVNWTTAGSGLVISRNPWRIALLKGVQLPMEPRVQNAHIVPPASMLNQTVAANWLAANWGVFHRFRLDKMTRIRYVRFRIGTQSGNIKVGVGKLCGTNHDWYHPIKDTGFFACPAAGDAKIDLGMFVLPPGDYAVYLAASLTTFQTFMGSAAPAWVEGSKILGVQTVGAGATAREGFALDFGAGATRFVSGLTLEGDYI